MQRGEEEEEEEEYPTYTQHVLRNVRILQGIGCVSFEALTRKSIYLNIRQSGVRWTHHWLRDHPPGVVTAAPPEFLPGHYMYSS